MHNLERFVVAQDPIYATALAELRRGRKESHWMWFVFPQLAGLGRSARALFYGLRSAEEAAAYLSHELLGPRLRECTRTVLDHAGRPAEAIFGHIDAIKFRSSMTLFEAVSGVDEPFGQALQHFNEGRRDPATLERLGLSGPA